MHVSRLHFKNWGPFKGDHVLLLEPTFYAVTARLENDRERSNFLGKTSLLEAIRFALFGEHRHRLEDSWITDGESDGLVGIELDARFSILRKRVRGKSTKLQAFEYGEKEAVGDEAGDLIQRWLGLGEEDFDACHLAQGRASAFVTGDSSWRTERVVAWCGIERLERCRDATRADALERELGELRAMASTAFERWQRALAGSSSVEELEQKAGACEAQFAGVKSRLGEALAEQAEGAKNARAAHAASEY
jgi:DNA repair exonuclease SbcCD ATPase subunit